VPDFAVIRSFNSIPLRSAGYAAALRAELCERAHRFAEKHGLPCVHSYGSQPVVVFSPYRRAGKECETCVDGDQHGNFLDVTYKAVRGNDNWRRRLDKVHTQGRSSLPRGDRGQWRELDTCTSSDALLMNVFSYPSLWRDGRVADLLGVERSARPRFGVPARVPLLDGKFDRTEVDMVIAAPEDANPLLVEAKLTEFDFQSAPIAVVAAYRDFDEIFQRSELARVRGRYLSYQLIRNVLAAYAMNASFCVLADARRPDLVEAWYATMRAVRPVDLRLRCKVLTWQELAAAAPPRLQAFLEEKYGIVAT
jgi:hypothetical protein